MSAEKADGYAYSLHHTKLPQYMRDMKKYHLAHHYKNFELGFGVTSTCSFLRGSRAFTHSTFLQARSGMSYSAHTFLFNVWVDPTVTLLNLGLHAFTNNRDFLELYKDDLRRFRYLRLVGL